MGFLKDISLKGKEYTDVIKNGERIETFLFRCFFIKQKGKESKKLGLVVNKKIGMAVARNRIRRLLREAYRKRYGEIAQGTIIVIQAKIIVRESWKKLKLEDIERDLKTLWKRVIPGKF